MGNIESTPEPTPFDDPTYLTTSPNSYNSSYTGSSSFQSPQNPRNSLHDLVNSSISNPSALDKPNMILDVNPLFIVYADFSKYQDVFDITTYFKNVYDIALSAEDTAIVYQQLQSAKTANKNTVLNIPKKSFTGNPSSDDVYVTLSKSDVDEAMQIYNVCKTLKDKLSKEFVSESQNNRIGDQITRSHKKMQHYMDVIITTITYHYFTVVQGLIKNKLDSLFANNTTNSEASQKMRRAAMIFGSMWDTPTQSIFTSLSEFMQAFFSEVFQLKGTVTDPENIHDLKSLGNGDVYNKAAYYMVRDFVAKAIEKRKGNCQDVIKNIKATEGPDVAAYFNKLVTDVYIKCSYPLLQYIFISSMMKQYMLKGDFVNTRLALFSKVNLILYITSVLSLVIQNFANNGNYATVNQNELSSIATMLNDILSKLNMYIENMNNIDMTSPNANADDEIAKIIQRLREMSNEVQSDSKEIGEIQKSIETSRLAIRNVLYNLTIIESKRKLRLIEFWIAFSVLVLLIVSCVALLLLKQEQIALYVSGLTVLLVLIYKLVIMIISFIKKN
jgi:hypothetical protein